MKCEDDVTGVGRGESI